jgi:hypothetical protein
MVLYLLFNTEEDNEEDRHFIGHDPDAGVRTFP